MAFELSFVFLVWHPLWRPIVLSAALLMHLAIALSMGLGAFSAAMLTGCLAFVPPWFLRLLIAAAEGERPVLVAPPGSGRAHPGRQR